MKTHMMDNEPAGGDGRVEDEGTTNRGLTTEPMAGMKPLADEMDEDSAHIESNTLGGTSGTGAGSAIGDGKPADTDE